MSDLCLYVYTHDGKHRARVDADKLASVSAIKWSLTGSTKKYFYNRQHGYLHRYVWGAASEQELDHINGDAFDNRICNLRTCTHSQNLANRTLVVVPGRYRGVRYHDGSYKARVGTRPERYLGSYETAEDAARARDIAAYALFGEFAQLNFPHRLNEPPPIQARRKPKNCAWCSQCFEQPALGAPKLYCSTVCSNSERNSRRRSA